MAGRKNRGPSDKVRTLTFDTPILEHMHSSNSRTACSDERVKEETCVYRYVRRQFRIIYMLIVNKTLHVEQ